MRQHTENFEQQLMQELCRYIEANSDQPVTLNKLAAQAQLSPTYLQRRFKVVIGVTPKEYLQSCRIKDFKKDLRTNSSVTETIYDTGFGSASRVYERSNDWLGMTPKQYQRKGKNLEISYGAGKISIGKILLAATEKGLCFLSIGDSEKFMLEELKKEFPDARISPMSNIFYEQFGAWMAALSSYLNGKKTDFNLALDIQGTAFQTRVWKYLQRIPVGKTVSYTDIARAIGKPKAVRAVANACGQNNISIVIPCHRVLRANGEISGYRWGVKYKRALLDLEKKIN